MNSKITLNKIAAELAIKSGKKSRDCEVLLKALFATIGNALEEGESVRIKGFGTFKISRVEQRKSVDVSSGNDTEIPAHQRVVFIPAKELASAVNAPFEMFETTELEEQVMEEDLMQAEADGNDLEAGIIAGSMMLEKEKLHAEENPKEFGPNYPKVEPAAEKPESESIEPEHKEPESKPGETEAESEEPEPESEPKAEQESEQEYEPEHEEPEQNSIESEIHHDKSKRKSTFGHGFAWGIVATILVLLAGCVTLYFLNDDFAGFSRNLFSSKEKNVLTQGNDSNNNTAASSNNKESKLQEANLADEGDVLAEEADGAPDIVEDVVADRADNEVPTKPSDPITYDTITKTHYLTTMAKKHYGNYHLWPYIYKENEKILGHPDRIRPGTRVVIPKLSKYGVNPKNRDDIEKAKKLGVEIYSRYK